ncbi:MAG: hypothetical protein QOF14_3896 [Hyphomicrobiales bacterium]|nr:hypothetical protein [Hyphomicrobiales bacterium]
MRANHLVNENLAAPMHEATTEQFHTTTQTISHEVRESISASSRHDVGVFAIMSTSNKGSHAMPPPLRPAFAPDRGACL